MIRLVMRVASSVPIWDLELCILCKAAMRIFHVASKAKSVSKRDRPAVDLEPTPPSDGQALGDRVHTPERYVYAGIGYATLADLALTLCKPVGL